MRLAQGFFGGFAGDVFRAQIDQKQMAFGAAGYNAQTAFDQLFGHRLGVGFYLFGVGFELGLQRFFKGHGFGGDHVHQRAALQAGENG